MNAPVTTLEQAYVAGLEAYLRQAGEGGLSDAYELGRRALVDGLGVLDMAELHRVAIERVVLTAAPRERARYARAAAEYFNELLSAFEMSFRGYRTANDELQHLNKSLRLQKAALESVNRELEAFSRSVSHDLRNPIASIDGFRRLLLQSQASRLDEQGQRYLGYIHQATGKMLQLIDGQLSLARVAHMEMQRKEVDLTALAREVAERLRASAPQRRVELVIEPDMRPVGDERLLAVLLENLLGNAWKFTSKQPAARIEVGTEQRAGRTVYYVRDNGAGFDMAQAPRLFGTFSRLHSERDFEGTGIGLATVQRIVHRHDGEIWATAAPNEGASFHFTLEGGHRS